MDSLQDASPCAPGQWLAALLLSLCCLLPTCLPAAAQSVDFSWPAEDNVVVRQGDTAILRCYLEDGTSKGAWLNRSSIIFAGNDKWSVDPRVSIVSSTKREYSLQIQKVEVTDDGQFTCSVQTQYNPKTLQMHLIVQVPPKIFDISASSVVNEFSNVTLFCMANGKPEPTITWKHISPSAKDFISEGEYLEIYGITRNQAGFYECLANNDVSIADTRTVRITVNYPPAIKEIKSPGMVLGKVGLLRCEAFAVPAAAFEWYKGDKRLASGRQGIHIKNFNTRSILTVTNITEDHYGNYTCVAANKLGTSSASHFLHMPSKEQYGITGGAEVILSWWYLVMALSCLVSSTY
ncbi:neuronal growth regulator 1 [Leucoraja erinacea]|uniref:neuronal growth regulator 1 n=1 Tax=Leucoraja erinaceus TaxID=7782 RepID=UPI002457A563|nr:neuronal growth regulator 1 [Leucoraja erinacea]